MAKSTLTKGKQAFLDYYSNLLPQFSDVENLKAFLSRRNTPVLLVSPLHELELQRKWLSQKLTWKALDWFPHAIYWPEGVQVNTSLPGFTTGWIYSLNSSSLLPALALKPEPSDLILDASAAPGGKSLSIINLLHPHAVHLVANDVSLPRFKRLKTVLKLYGYPNIPTTCYSIQSFPYHFPEKFDKILLDAPCSSEKHVYNSKQHLKIWSPKRILTVAHLQSLLIESLVRLLKPNGILVYSTCALAPQENEEIVNQATLRHSLKLLSMERKNETDTNFDPMFVAKLQLE